MVRYFSSEQLFFGYILQNLDFYLVSIATFAKVTVNQPKLHHLPIFFLIWLSSSGCITEKLLKT